MYSLLTSFFDILLFTKIQGSEDIDNLAKTTTNIIQYCYQTLLGLIAGVLIVVAIVRWAQLASVADENERKKHIKSIIWLFIASIGMVVSIFAIPALVSMAQSNYGA